MTHLLLAAAAIALLELDVASFGQLMVGRPLVVGPLLGLAFRSPALGAGLGALFELFSLGELPVGGKLPLNGTVGVGAAFLLTAAGGVPVELAFALGLLAAFGHGKLETGLRRLRSGAIQQAASALSRGEDPSLFKVAVRELSLQFGATFGVLILALGARAALVSGAVPVPEALSGGLRLGLALAPWIGIAAALSALKGAA